MWCEGTGASMWEIENGDLSPPAQPRKNSYTTLSIPNPSSTTGVSRDATQANSIYSLRMRRETAGVEGTGKWREVYRGPACEAVIRGALSDTLYAFKILVIAPDGSASSPASEVSRIHTLTQMPEDVKVSIVQARRVKKSHLHKKSLHIAWGGEGVKWQVSICEGGVGKSPEAGWREVYVGSRFKIKLPCPSNIVAVRVAGINAAGMVGPCQCVRL